uniref:Uncharacterized protein n=1 Tax=Panagrolaimus sp. JU765 TaxID=591449 RepID=A0AC34QQH1_9BILA
MNQENLHQAKEFIENSTLKPPEKASEFKNDGVKEDSGKGKSSDQDIFGTKQSEKPIETTNPADKAFCEAAAIVE